MCSFSVVLTKPLSAAVWRCIKMHHGYISSHILVRTACQGPFPLGRMWSGIKLYQQFRPMIDGIQALNCGACGVPTSTYMHIHYTLTHTSEGLACCFVFERRRHCNRTYWPHLLTGPLGHHSWSHTASEPGCKTIQLALIWHSRWPNHSGQYNRASINFFLFIY